jgi:hypothetical protein
MAKTRKARGPSKWKVKFFKKAGGEFRSLLAKICSSASLKLRDVKDGNGEADKKRAAIVFESIKETLQSMVAEDLFDVQLLGSIGIDISGVEIDEEDDDDDDDVVDDDAVADFNKDIL